MSDFVIFVINDVPFVTGCVPFVSVWFAFVTACVAADFDAEDNEEFADVLAEDTADWAGKWEAIVPAASRTI